MTQLEWSHFMQKEGNTFKSIKLQYSEEVKKDSSFCHNSNNKTDIL
jgi:hypothetical protein